MIITEHEGIRIQILVDEGDATAWKDVIKLKVQFNNIPLILAISTFRYNKRVNDKTTVKTGYKIELEGARIRFDTLEVADIYFDYLCNYEKNKDLDILKENSSLGI